MKTVSVVAQKGGSGKSTIAVHLAGEATRRGVRTFIGDMDPQQTALAWSRLRQGQGLKTPQVIALNATQLPPLLAEAGQKGFGCAILDTPGRVDAITEFVDAESDVIVVPMRPTYLDLSALEATLKQLTDLSKVVLVLSQVPQFAGDTQQIRQLLAQRYPTLRVFPGALLHRVPFYRALGHGLTAAEIPDPSSSETNAAREIAELYDYLETIGAKQ